MEADDDFGFTSAVDLQQAYAARRVSPVEVAGMLLDRIEAINPRFNALTMSTPDLALAQARAAETAYAAGNAVRPLEGVPVTIKDMHPTKGLPTNMGSYATKGWVPEEDAPCIARLHAAGTVMLGKTTVPEFGWIGCEPEHAHRDHAQSLETRLQRWRFVGRSSGGLRRRLRAAPPGLRRWGLSADAGAFLRRFWAEAHLWAHSLLACPQQ